MRYLLSAFCILLFSIEAIAQHCCEPSAIDAYAMNGADRNFRQQHPEPLPFHYASAAGKDINYPTPDGQTAHGWEVKAAKPSAYTLFVVHEWWGLNDYIKQTAEKLGKELGINVVALDLYDGQVAATRDEAGKLMQAVEIDRAVAIIEGAFTYVGEKAKVFTIGWCFGGGWSLQAAMIGGSQTAGCVMYYGAPEKRIDRLKTLQCDVIGFFGNLDKWPNPAAVTEFAENMEKAGKKLVVNRYNANHGFANPSNPDHDKDATIDAHFKTINFIRGRMK